MANLRYLRNDYIRFSSLCFIKKRSFDFFRFSSSSQSLTKTFVSLRSCTIKKSFTSFCFVFANFWKTSIRFTFDFDNVGLCPFASLHSSKILEQPGRFCFVVENVRTPFRFVSSWRNWRINHLVFASIFAFLLFLFLSLSWTVLLSQFVFASILKSCMLVLFVSLRYWTFPRMKLRFRFDLDKLKANTVRFASILQGSEKFYNNTSLASWNYTGRTGP
jgi:hypothetical protein